MRGVWELLWMMTMVGFYLGAVTGKHALSSGDTHKTLYIWCRLEREGPRCTGLGWRRKGLP